MQKISRHRRLLTVTALALICGGCGGVDRPAVAPVRGRVLYQGEPVAGADVTFVCDGAPRHAFGTTDAEGNFTLTTFDPGDGAVVGVNRVTVARTATAPDGLGGDLPDEEAYFRAVAEAEGGAAVESGLPPRYADPETSDLTFTVVAGENEPLLELRD